MLVSRLPGFAAALIAFGLAGGAFAAETAPKVETALKTPLPYPYDEGADAKAEVAAAIERAAAEHKLVLLDFGGNWCPDCRVTAGVFALPEVKPWIARNFEVVAVDIGRLTRNLDIGARYNVDIKSVPTIIIIDAQGHVVNSGNPAALKDARSMSPQAIVDTISGWIKQPG